MTVDGWRRAAGGARLTARLRRIALPGLSCPFNMPKTTRAPPEGWLRGARGDCRDAEGYWLPPWSGPQFGVPGGQWVPVAVWLSRGMLLPVLLPMPDGAVVTPGIDEPEPLL